MPAGQIIPAVTLAAVGAAATYTPPSAQLSGSPASPVLFRISGPFAGLTGVFEGSFDLSGAFANAFPIRAMQAADGAIVSGTVSVPDSTAANPAAAGYYAFPDAGMAVRFRATALSSGAPVVDGRTTDFFPNGSGGAASSNVQVQTLLELQRIRLGLSILCDVDLKAGAPVADANN